MRKTFVLWILTILALDASAQWKKYYSLDQSADNKLVNLNLKATHSSCIIKPVQNDQAVTVYGGLSENSSVNPVFTTQLANKTQHLNIALDQEQPQAVSASFKNQFMSFFNTSTSSDVWKIYLSENNPFSLNLNYVIGDARVDLSGLSISNLKINTASADVKVTYLADMKNRVQMDTFLIKVDMGAVQVEKMAYSQARNVIAEVGFGKMMLDLSDETTLPSNVSASVGAGTLMILLNSNDALPTIIYINESPLCHVRLTKDFREIKKNVFVNTTYAPDAENLLSFNVDVAMGNIIFKTK